MGNLSDMLSAPPPPAYETVARFRSNGLFASDDDDEDGNAGRPGGLATTLWLTILQHTVRADKGKGKEREAQGYADLHRNVRFVCKDFYLLSMHLCRARYLQRYLSRVRAPYTTNPYPTGQDAAASASTSRASATQYAPVVMLRSGEGAGRETRILDLFVAASVRHAVEAFESSLLDSTLADDAEGEKDLFAYHQPKARLEDLVIAQGCRVGLLRSDYHHITSDSKRRPIPSPAAVKAEDLAVELTGRSAALRVRNAQSSSRALRTVLEIPRARNETLETTARNILYALQEQQQRQ